VLTGLVNPPRIRKPYGSGAQEVSKAPKRLTDMLPDLDQFKIVNFTCATRRRCLLGTVGALLIKVRWRDTAGAMGGDEFGILLESCSWIAMRRPKARREQYAIQVYW